MLPMVAAVRGDLVVTAKLLFFCPCGSQSYSRHLQGLGFSGQGQGAITK